jgi:flavin-dependent dehydrogenase
VRIAHDVNCWLRRLRQTEHLRQIYEQFQYTVLVSPTVVSAGSSKLSPAGGNGWLAAGDAAISFDPLSSQGIITALSTGRQAAEAMLESRNGNPAAMAQYLSRLDYLDRDYLYRRLQYYALERRWAGSAFWRRRSANSQ